jgi:mRNA interferase RelE/StbE
MYQVRFLKPATGDLARLDKSVGARIVQRIRWLAESVDAIQPRRLRGELAGLSRIREGDYRIIYQVLRREKTVVVHCIGHRRDIYR